MVPSWPAAGVQAAAAAVAAVIVAAGVAAVETAAVAAVAVAEQLWFAEQLLLQPAVQLVLLLRQRLRLAVRPAGPWPPWCCPAGDPACAAAPQTQGCPSAPPLPL